MPDVLDLIEDAIGSVEQRVARWPAGWSLMGLLLFGLVLTAILQNRTGDVVLLVGGAFVLYARRHFFWRDLRTSWMAFLVLGGVFACPYYANSTIDKPGDVAESPGERAVGAFQWRPYDAAHNGTAPLPMYDRFVVSMKPGARFRVRPSQSKSDPGIYIVQLDGEALIEVKPGVPRLTIAGKDAQTVAALPPGTYEVRGNVEQNVVEVRRVSGSQKVEVSGGARLVVD